MGTEIDVRKVVKYPPEALVSAIPVDLTAGDNKVAEYVVFSPRILVFQGFSFSRVDGLNFYANVDGFAKAVNLDNLGAVKGLDYEEDLKFPAVKSCTLKIYAPTAVSGYQLRHRVIVFEPTTVLKLLFGLELTHRDRELAKKYGLEELLKATIAKPFELWGGVEKIFTMTEKLSSSGNIARIVVPEGYKAILMSISVLRPDSAGKAYIDVSRDDVETLHLDPYCLANLSYNVPMRVVGLDKIVIDLDVRVSGDYYVRVVYGLGKLTVREKIMWKLGLSDEEKRVAESLDLYDRVEAGVE